MKKLIIFCFFLVFSWSTKAQPIDSYLANFNRSQNALEACPSTMPEFYFNIVGPQIEFAYRSNFSVSDLFTSNQEGVKVLDLRNLLSSDLSGNPGFSRLGMDMAMRHRGIGMGISPGKNFYVYAGTNRHVQLGFDLPTGALAGTDLVGNDVNLVSGDPNSLSIRALGYYDKHFGFVANTGFISLGARYRILNGIFTVKTEKGQLSLDTSQGNKILQNDLLFKVANWNGFNILDQPVENIPNLSDFFTNTSNRGQALDFGIGFNLGKAIRLQFAVNNVNAIINWSENCKTFTSNTGKEYKEPLIAPAFNSNPILLFKGLQDTIRTKFELQESSVENFSTTLPVQYLGAVHLKLHSLLQLGLIYQQRRDNNNSIMPPINNLVTYVQTDWGAFLSGRLMYSLSSNSSSQLGAFLAVRLIGVQAFAGLSTIGDVINQKSYSAHAGLSFNLGRRKSNKTSNSDSQI